MDYWRDILIWETERRSWDWSHSQLYSCTEMRKYKSRHQQPDSTLKAFISKSVSVKSTSTLTRSVQIFWDWKYFCWTSLMLQIIKKYKNKFSLLCRLDAHNVDYSQLLNLTDKCLHTSEVKDFNFDCETSQHVFLTFYQKSQVSAH